MPTGWEPQKRNSVPATTVSHPAPQEDPSWDLSNVLVVVIRYFGGTLLGVGGLIHAYREAAADALKNSRIVEAAETESIRVLYPYDLTKDIMKIVDEEKIGILDQVFTDSCSLMGRVRKSRVNKVLERINALPGASARMGEPRSAGDRNTGNSEP
jgi:putative IMPACT (imprinted ancient) family translation regulator